MSEHAQAPAWDPPSATTVRYYVDALRKALRRHEQDAGQAASLLRILNDVKDKGGLQPKDADGTSPTEILGQLSVDSTLADARVASVKALIERAAKDPASLFLPIGATVRMRDVSRPESWKTSDGRPPVPGTTGVVMGPLFQGSEWAVKVAFTDFVDTAGDRWTGDIDEPRTFYLDADDLEVVSLGRHLDGTPCRSVDFVQTHHRPEDEDAMAMVVEADGVFWVLETIDEGRERWLSVQGWESADDLDHLAPVDQRPAGPAR